MMKRTKRGKGGGNVIIEGFTILVFVTKVDLTTRINVENF